MKKAVFIVFAGLLFFPAYLLAQKSYSVDRGRMQLFKNRKGDDNVT